MYVSEEVMPCALFVHGLSFHTSYALYKSQSTAVPAHVTTCSMHSMGHRAASCWAHA
jgi:hypothetical protein